MASLRSGASTASVGSGLSGNSEEIYRAERLIRLPYIREIRLGKTPILSPDTMTDPRFFTSREHGVGLERGAQHRARYEGRRLGLGRYFLNIVEDASPEIERDVDNSHLHGAASALKLGHSLCQRNRDFESATGPSSLEEMYFRIVAAAEVRRFRNSSGSACSIA